MSVLWLRINRQESTIIIINKWKKHIKRKPISFYFITKKKVILKKNQNQNNGQKTAICACVHVFVCLIRSA
jgi:hypothetical protein